jgi:biofilm PGA synthesis N-glycosyltransferase PgaC
VISPVKDEAGFVERTLRSVAAQTLPPTLWVIVDDGSTDGTGRILDRFAGLHPWIRVVHREPGARREAGSRVIQNFQLGYERVRDEPCDFIVKLDCDLDIPADYFEHLVERFEQDPALGIASGIYSEERDGEWVAIEMPGYHAAGAMKMVRRECFREIGGFVAARGWDTVDEIKAQVRGWKTAHFPDLMVRHLKDEGSGVGFLDMSRISGEIHYLTGGGPLFFAVKSVHRLLFGRPLIAGSVAMVLGYLRCVGKRRNRLVDDREVRHYRKLLNRRMLEAMMRLRSVAPGGGRARYS